MPAVVLWDIDYTLLHSGGVDRRIWSSVCAGLLGVPAREPTVVPGATVPELLHDILLQFGASPRRATDLLTEALREEVEQLAKHLPLLVRRGAAMPGARAALDALAGPVADGALVQSVLTGNQQRGARIKLDAFGLAEGLDLSAGAYGCDHRERSRLVAVARARVRSRYGRRYATARTILVGDSLRDIAAARDTDARVVAVATGSYPEGELAEAGADVVLADLRDTAAVTTAILALAG